MLFDRANNLMTMDSRNLCMNPQLIMFKLNFYNSNFHLNNNYTHTHLHYEFNYNHLMFNHYSCLFLFNFKLYSIPLFLDYIYKYLIIRNHKYFQDISIIHYHVFLVRSNIFWDLSLMLTYINIKLT